MYKPKEIILVIFIGFIGSMLLVFLSTVSIPEQPTVKETDNLPINEELAELMPTTSEAEITNDQNILEPSETESFNLEEPGTSLREHLSMSTEEIQDTLATTGIIGMIEKIKESLDGSKMSVDELSRITGLSIDQINQLRGLSNEDIEKMKKETQAWTENIKSIDETFEEYKSNIENQETVLFLPRNEAIKIIRENAFEKWDDNYSMVEYEINNQTEAYDWIKGQENHPEIMTKAKQKWNNNYPMIKYEYESQVEAYEWLNQQIAYPEIMKKAKQKWDDNYSMVRYEYENQVEAYENL